jgi:hypothetical protein
MTTDQKSALDTQVGGDHYKKLGAYQPWEVLRAWLTPEEFRGYMKGTAIAYLAREKDKGGMQDIDKAAHTLQGLSEMTSATASQLDLEFPLGAAYMTGDGEVGLVSHSDAKKFAANSSGIVSPLPPLFNRRKEDTIKPANDNWIDWQGGPIPVPHKRLVEVRMRDGTQPLMQPAGAFRWLHADGSAYMNDGGDVVAYRVTHG